MKKKEQTMMKTRDMVDKTEDNMITPSPYPIITLIGVPSGGLPANYICNVLQL